MNLLLTFGITISCVVLIAWSLLSVLADLLASISAAPTFQFGETADDAHEHHGANVLGDGY
jgi:hypothetical protein